MKKSLLAVAFLSTMIWNESLSQDFSSYCSTTVTGTTANKRGILVAQNGIEPAEFVNGQFVAKVDTLAGKEAFMSWFVDEFWVDGGAAITNSTFSFKVKSSFSGNFTIRATSEYFSKKYNVPLVTSKPLVGGADFINYSITFTDPATFNKDKFQEFIFAIVPTADVVGGTLTIKDFSYGTNGCVPTGVNSNSDVVLGYSLFPNPSLNNEVNISAVLKNVATSKIVVKNLAGVEVYSSSATNSTVMAETINTYGWAKGIYAVSLVVDGVISSTRKLSVQ